MSIRAEGVTKEYIRESKGTNRFFAVKETDITIESGALTVLMGRSGSGKSTLLNILAGLIVPSSGRVFLDETDLYALPDAELSRLRNKRIGVIPQGQTALHSLTVMENVMLPYTLYKDAGEKDEQYARYLLEQLDIAELAGAMPSELSGGELRRMAIARALVRKPGVILADEPTGDLDDENTETVFRCLKSFAQDGAAVLVVTHENGAEDYADRLLKMSAGTIQ